MNTHKPPPQKKHKSAGTKKIETMENRIAPSSLVAVGGGLLASLEADAGAAATDLSAESGDGQTGQLGRTDSYIGTGGSPTPQVGQTATARQLMRNMLLREETTGGPGHGVAPSGPVGEVTPVEEAAPVEEVTPTEDVTLVGEQAPEESSADDSEAEDPPFVAGTGASELPPVVVPPHHPPPPFGRDIFIPRNELDLGRLPVPGGDDGGWCGTGPRPKFDPGELINPDKLGTLTNPDRLGSVTQPGIDLVSQPGDELRDVVVRPPAESVDIETTPAGRDASATMPSRDLADSVKDATLASSSGATLSGALAGPSITVDAPQAATFGASTGFDADASVADKVSISNKLTANIRGVDALAADGPSARAGVDTAGPAGAVPGPGGSRLMNRR